MIDIDALLVERLVSEQFPQWANLHVRPVEFSGMANKTFRLGSEMSVRMPNAEKFSWQVKKEHRWLPILAPLLPLSIPVPVGMGMPALGYTWHWSVYRWIDGEDAAIAPIADPLSFSVDLANFLAALQQINFRGGPTSGQHNFFRGGDLSVYDSDMQHYILTLDGMIDTEAIKAAWDAALRATWCGSPVWFHGDLGAENLLVKHGTLCGVIDFGGAGIGDPACDLAIAWTHFSKKSREAFRAALAPDDATWTRGRGWALRRSVMKLVRHMSINPIEAATDRNVIEELLAEYKRGA